jgi:hypothetical protein
MTGDTFDKFAPPERGRFGDNELAPEPRTRQRVTGASDLKDLELKQHAKTKAGVLVSDGSANKKPQWLPLSQVEIEGWGIADHAKRILDCPGVIDFLRCDGEIVVVPDAIVDDIREIENRERPSVLAAAAIAAAGGASKKKKKRWRNGRKSKIVQDNGDEVVAVYPYSPILASMEGLTAAARISAFLSALGLGGRPE